MTRAETNVRRSATGRVKGDERWIRSVWHCLRRTDGRTDVAVPQTATEVMRSRHRSSLLTTVTTCSHPVNVADQSRRRFTESLPVAEVNDGLDRTVLHMCPVHSQTSRQQWTLLCTPSSVRPCVWARRVTAGHRSCFVVGVRTTTTSPEYSLARTPLAVCATAASRSLRLGST